jgi:hypothetical protein
MLLCGNFIELVEKNKILTHRDFERWYDTNLNHNYDIEIYSVKDLIPELEEKPIGIISATIGMAKGN